MPRSIAFTSAYLNGCSDFIDLWQTIQAFDGFTIPEYIGRFTENIYEWIYQEMKKCDQPAW